MSVYWRHQRAMMLALTIQCYYLMQKELDKCMNCTIYTGGWGWSNTSHKHIKHTPKIVGRSIVLLFKCIYLIINLMKMKQQSKTKPWLSMCQSYLHGSLFFNKRPEVLILCWQAMPVLYRGVWKLVKGISVSMKSYTAKHFNNFNTLSRAVTFSSVLCSAFW